MSDEIVTQSFSFQPQNLTEAMNYAKLMSESDLVPKDFKGKPGNCLVAVQMGKEIGLLPFQALQNIAVINGRPGIYGDIGKALLLREGCAIEERDVSEIRKMSAAECKITRPDGRTQTRSYSVDDAKAAGLWGKQGPWTTNTYRQMAWRAFWFAARDVAADLLRGMSGAEELLDYQSDERNVTLMPPQRKSKPATAEPELIHPKDLVVSPIQSYTGYQGQGVFVTKTGGSSVTDLNEDPGPPDDEPQQAVVRVISTEQCKRLWSIARSVGWKDQEVKNFLVREYAIDSSKLIPVHVYDEIINLIQSGSKE